MNLMNRPIKIQKVPESQQIRKLYYKTLGTVVINSPMSPHSLNVLTSNTYIIKDVTSMYTVLSLIGPKSKDLMEEMSGSDMTMEPLTYK